MKNTKRFIVSILLLSMIMSLLIGCTTTKKDKKKTDDDISNKKEFTLGFDAEFPPYGYRDDATGEYVGFDIDLAKEMCERRGWKLKLQPIDLDSKDIELKTGAIDCIWNGFTINGREEGYAWSKAYLDNKQVVVVKADSDIKELKDLAGKVVVVQADSSALAAFTGDDATEENKALCATFADLQQVGDYNTAFLNLDSGSVNAICLDIGVAYSQMNNRKDTFRMLETSVSSEQYGIGFKKGNVKLRDAVQETLDAMLADGKFDEIAKKWDDYGISEMVCLGKTGTDSAYNLSVDESSIKDKKEFTLGFDAEFPPYGFRDEESGEYVGFDIDLAREVCERRGWTLKLQPIAWDSKDIELNIGSIDCIWNGFTINGRENDYTWSKAYLDNKQVVVVKKDSDIKNLADLAGKMVLVQSDSSALAAFTGDDATPENIALCASFEDLQQVADYNTAFLNLDSGSAHAVCLDIGVAYSQIKNRGDEFRMLDDSISSEQYGIGFKLGNTALRNAVQTTLDEMLADGKVAEIAKKWDDYGISEMVCLGKDGTDSAYKINTNNAKQEQSIWEKFVDVTKSLSKGMLASLVIFVLTLLFSLPLGLLITFIRMSKVGILRGLAKIYISILRGTPLMLQLLVVFFGPYYVFGMRVSSNFRFYAVIIGFSLNYAAYFAEIFRSGIEGIPVGQREAADVLGYSRAQTFTKIIFPQMVRRVIPPVTNEVITLVKDTSLAFALAYTEMFTLAKQVAAARASVMPLFVAGIFYYIFNFVVAVIMNYIEKKMNYDKE